MAFILLVCSEVRSEKINIEFPFEVVPTLNEFSDLVERVFRFEASNSNRPNVEPLFLIGRIQVYSDDNRQWEDLVSADQFHMYDQLYVFRRNAAVVDNSSRREIPRPRTSVYFSTGPSAARPSSSPVPTQQLERAVAPQIAPSIPPSRLQSRSSTQVESVSERDISRIAVEEERKEPTRYSRRAERQTPRQQVNAPESTAGGQLSGRGDVNDPLRVVFDVADRRHYTALVLHDFVTLFKVVNLALPGHLIEQMFTQYARGGVGAARPRSNSTSEAIMNFSDFSEWAKAYGTIANALYQRILSIDQERRLVERQDEIDHRLSDLEQERSDLEESLRRVHADIVREHDRRGAVQDDLEALLKERIVGREEELLLIEKEIRVQQQRELLKKEEQEYIQLADMRKRRSESTRSFSGVVEQGNTSMARPIYSTPSRPAYRV
jgi:hypothetical protein